MQTLNNITGVLSLIMPADGLQRKMQAVLFSFENINGLIPVSTSGPFGIGEIPSTAFLIYAAFYTAVLFGLGLRRFCPQGFIGSTLKFQTSAAIQKNCFKRPSENKKGGLKRPPNCLLYSNK